MGELARAEVLNLTRAYAGTVIPTVLLLRSFCSPFARSSRYVLLLSCWNLASAVAGSFSTLVTLPRGTTGSCSRDILISSFMRLFSRGSFCVWVAVFPWHGDVVIHKNITSFKEDTSSESYRLTQQAGGQAFQFDGTWLVRPNY
jgi:hypothetical protein